MKNIFFCALTLVLLCLGTTTLHALEYQTANGEQLEKEAWESYQKGYSAENPKDQAKHFEEAARKYEEAAKAYEAEGQKNKAESARKMAHGARQNAEHRRKMSAASSTPITQQLVATGRTTGHIADLVVTNPSARPSEVSLPPFSIPSDGAHQGYIVPEPPTFTATPNGETRAPVTGLCTNPNLPPPPAGTILGGPDHWPSPPFPMPTFFSSMHSIIAALQGDGQLPPLFSAPQMAAPLLQMFAWYYTAPTKFDPCEHLRTTGRFFDWSVTEREAVVAQTVNAMLRVGRAANVPDFIPPSFAPHTVLITPAPPSSALSIERNIRVTSTGNTSGHIADISITNPTKEPMKVLIGNGNGFVIPSRGDYQPYAVLPVSPIDVPPGATVTRPLLGMCAEVRKPPVPAGNHMPDTRTWVQPSGGGSGKIPLDGTTIPLSTTPSLADVTPILQSPPLAPAFARRNCPEVPLASHSVLIPGTDTPIKAPISLSDNLGLATPILVEALSRIVQAADDLISSGAISTPFKSNPPKEREAVIQQTFWIFSAALQGNPYTYQDFHGNTVRQFENNTGRKYDQLPQAQKDQLNKGVDDFWDAFQATGTEAKVLPFLPLPPMPPPADGDDDNDLLFKPIPSMTHPLQRDPLPGDILIQARPQAERTPRCRCDSIAYNLRVTKGNVAVHDAREVHAGERSALVRVTDRNFRLGDVYDVSISNIVIRCTCNGATCTFYPKKSANTTNPDMARPGKATIAMPEENESGVAGGSHGGNNNIRRSNGEWNADGTAYAFRLHTQDERTLERSVFQDFEVKSYCIAPECGKRYCAIRVRLGFVDR